MGQRIRITRKKYLERGSPVTREVLEAQPEGLITTRQAADYLKIHTNTLQTWSQKGIWLQVAYKEPGMRFHLYRAADVLAFEKTYVPGPWKRLTDKRRELLGERRAKLVERIEQIDKLLEDS